METLIELIPVAMTIPNTEGIYALSQYGERKVVCLSEFKTYNYVKGRLRVGEITGECNFYGRGLDCWYIAREASPALVLGE